MVCAQDFLAGEKVLEFFQDIDDLRLRQFFWRKVSEFFQDKDDLQLRQFCSRKSL